MPQTKILLDESDIPTHWYNVVADMPHPPSPPLGPDGKPIPPQALGAIFPEALIMQEVSGDAYDKYFSGQLENYEYPEAAVAASMQKLPKVG